jgi:hypothetical protein
MGTTIAPLRIRPKQASPYTGKSDRYPKQRRRCPGKRAPVARPFMESDACHSRAGNPCGSSHRIPARESVLPPACTVNNRALSSCGLRALHQQNGNPIHDRIHPRTACASQRESIRGHQTRSACRANDELQQFRSNNGLIRHSDSLSVRRSRIHYDRSCAGQEPSLVIRR